ncbi:MAG: Fic family protein [Amaricoccus sp.]
MILYDIAGGEDGSAYRTLETENRSRMHGFLRSAVAACLAADRPMLTEGIVKALNFHAMACLQPDAGAYRSCPVTVGAYRPPEPFRVPGLMRDLIDCVNRRWEASDPIELAAFVLWRINAIHPFVSGNGRTARAAAYFVLCVKNGGLLPGEVILPELLEQDHGRYVAGLRAADVGRLPVLAALVARLVAEQTGAPPPEGIVDALDAAEAEVAAPEASTSADNPGET